MPTKRDFSTLISDSTTDQLELSTEATLQNRKRRLRRLPHVFSKVMELPLSSDTDVSIEDLPHCFRFVAKADSLDGVAWAHTFEDHLGVKKVVVRRSGGCDNVDHELGQLDLWRFRLPDNSCPEAAKAVCGGGELVVTVPKKNGGGDGSGRDNGTMDNLVVVLISMHEVKL